MKIYPLLCRPRNYLTLEIIISKCINRKNKLPPPLSQAFTAYQPNAFTLSFYPYQKDRWALPGNLIKIRWSPHVIKCFSLLPHNFLFAPTLPLSFLTLSFFVFRRINPMRVNGANTKPAFTYYAISIQSISVHSTFLLPILIISHWKASCLFKIS
jgi:hypothetical protein